jgi:HlyD family secretion protein
MTTRKKSLSRTPGFRLRQISLPAVCVLSMGLCVVGCSSGKEESEAPPTMTVQVATVENKAIQQKVTADAVLYPLDQAAIVPKISAPVKKFYVNRGSTVHAGQLLAELESQDLAGTVAENQGGYIQAQAGYDAAVQKAQQDLDLAKQVLDTQQKLYDNRQALYKQGAVSAKDVDDASVSLTQARGQYAAAQKQFDLKVAEGQLTAAKGKAATAEADLSYARIISPIDGVVTDRPVYPGEMPPAGSPLITVMNVSQVVARAHVSPQEAASIKAGDAATVELPGETAGVAGKVTLVSPAVDPNSTTVEIWVQAPNPHGGLKPGASARVTIATQTASHAIVAPASALLTASDGATSVIVLDGGNKPHKQNVKVGIRDADDVQITDGLKVGDRVVTSGAFELSSEDDDVLAKTTVQIQAPKPAAGPDEDDAK